MPPAKPCFVERCPHCRRIGEFWLTQFSGRAGRTPSAGHSVACGACHFEKLISDAEAPAFARLAERYRLVLGGLLSIDAFEDEVDAAQMHTIEEIRQEARVWVCVKCQEENPLAFDSCWKCGAALPTAASVPDTPVPRPPDIGG